MSLDMDESVADGAAEPMPPPPSPPHRIGSDA